MFAEFQVQTTLDVRIQQQHSAVQQYNSAQQWTVEWSPTAAGLAARAATEQQQQQHQQQHSAAQLITAVQDRMKINQIYS